MTDNRPTWQRYARLMIAVMLVSAIWMGVLPLIGRMEAVQQHFDLLNEHHIDASAMFYTELDERLIPKHSLLEPSSKLESDDQL